MNDFNTKTLLKQRPIVTKQMLPLRDSRPSSAKTRPLQQPMNFYKETLQLKPKMGATLPTGKTLLQLRPSRCVSRDDSSARQGTFRSRASSPHSVSSGDHGYQSDHHDGDSYSHPGKRSLEQYCDFPWRSTNQQEIVSRSTTSAVWTTHQMLDQQRMICPTRNSRACALCGANGRYVHVAQDCPLRRSHLFH